ncbi:MAG: sigma-70 family RNA polymerase sigma factor [Candidatus Eisenbacteria bacterium]
MDDKQLVQACIAKDNRAWRQFLKSFGPLVYGSVAGLLAKFSIHEPEIAEDIFADVIEKLLINDCAALRKFSWKSKVSTWLVSVARNRTYDYLRRKKRRPTISLSTPIDNGEDELERVIAQDLDLEHDIEVEMTLNEALDMLPDKDRLIVNLYYIEGMKEREIAKLMSITVDSVSARKSRAMKKLKIMVRKRNP